MLSNTVLDLVFENLELYLIGVSPAMLPSAKQAAAVQ